MSFPDVEMNPAPGYDQCIPHDMMHLVVEAKLGLTRAVFGQLAAGGDAGTFHLSPQSQGTTRELARLRKTLKARGQKLLREGRDESLQSERATYICWNEWLARSQANTQTMAQQAKQVREVAPANELRKLDQTRLADICHHLDELSSHWSRLNIGEAVTIRWPDLAVVSESPLPA
ncbi:MAG: hypothetical protein V7638_1734 [Acidobacteriota bacterium]